MHTAQEYIEGVTSQNITLLSKALTLIESTKKEHQQTAAEVLNGCLPKAGNSIRIGITGVPGVGKSTFIEAFGLHLISQGKKVAVLAIDPTSQKNHGSILGDKTRMNELSAHPNAFVRPSPSAGALGGVTHATKESITLFEAAGYDVIIVETVGVGQSEIAVATMTDFFLLLMIPGAGDQLQGIKRGIMEMADALFINKADSGNESKANEAMQEYKNALHLFPSSSSGWSPKVLTGSALHNKGMDAAWETIIQYIELLKSKQLFDAKRKEQAKHWLHQHIVGLIQSGFYEHSSVKEKLSTIEEKVMSNKLATFAGAKELVDSFN